MTHLPLPTAQPTCLAFVDETGAISKDRFFAVGCLKIEEPSVLVRRIQKLRDRHHWYDEFHWVGLTRRFLPLYREVVQAASGVRGLTFSCFIVDRDEFDPVVRFGSPWKAYEKLAAQLLLGSIGRGELVTVLADDYSTPDDVTFEIDVRYDVNQRLGRCAVTSICRLDSRSAQPLQVVDILTSAVAFEFRQAAGLASQGSAKAELAEYVRRRLRVSSFLTPPVVNDRVNVRKYYERSRRAA